MRRRAGVRAGLLALLIAGCGGDSTAHRFPIPGEDGPRITVEVLNGTDVDGLARRVTGQLRAHGLDVVSFGSAPEPVESTRVLIRQGDSTAADRVREALGVGTIVADPDPRLLLDVTVLLGADAAALDRDP